MAIPLNARDFTYQGINYTVLDEDAKTCQTKKGELFAFEKSLPGSQPVGNLVLTNVVSDGTSTYRLVEISGYSFGDDLISIVIPDGVIVVGDFAFSCCKNLETIQLPNSITTIGSSAFSYCKELNEIVLPNSISVLMPKAFESCTKLKNVTLPNDVDEIPFGLFRGCVSLECVKLPSAVKIIGEKAFIGCRSLKTIDLPEGVETIKESAFQQCSALTSLTIPSSVVNIEDTAFGWCTGLSVVKIMGNAELGDVIFADCSLSELWIKGLVEYRARTFSQLSQNTHIICRREQTDEIKKIFKGSVYNFDVPYSVASSTSFLGGLKINFEKNPYYDGNIDRLRLTADIKALGNKVVENIEINPTHESFIKGLQPFTDYEVIFSWTPEHEGYASESSYSFRTTAPTVKCSYTSTQTTATINSVEADKDESVSPTIYIKANGKEVKYTGGKYEIKGLQPDKEYSLVYADYNGKRFDASSQTTKKVGLKISVTNEGSTSFKLSGSYQAGDAEIASAGWETMEAGKWKKIDDKNEVVICGLKPGSTHDYRYFAQIKGYGHIYSTVITKTLPALELNMLKPKCVSSTNAIVAAETNVADAEPNVGFQWKKYDAPASLAPNEGYAVVYDGVLEGYIRNLQTTSYYNVRAFYKDAENNYYFSDWTTFDPSDFSFFEPTVRTYPTEQIGQNNATLCGYVLAGTDDIIRQGFQYWLVSSPQNVSLASVPSTGVFTVEAQGQLMTAVLDGLRPDSKYAYRAFVQTKAGYMYGDEQSFKTLEVSGVEDVLMERSAPEIVGYYDLTGRRYTDPRRGLNIVVYSDGSSRKEYIR